MSGGNGVVNGSSERWLWVVTGSGVVVAGRDV